MTSTREKLRAFTLTVLMVVSVFAGTFAFAGTAAADPGNISGGNVNIDNYGGVAQERTNLSAAVVADFSRYSGGNTFRNVSVDFNQGGFDGSFDEVSLNQDQTTNSDVVVRIYEDSGAYDAQNQQNSIVPREAQIRNDGETLLLDLGVRSDIERDDVVEVRIRNRAFQNPTNGGDYTGTIDLTPRESPDADEQRDGTLSVGPGADVGGDADEEFFTTWVTGQDRYQGQQLNITGNDLADIEGTGPLNDYRLISCGDFDSDVYECSDADRIASYGDTFPNGVNITIDANDLEGEYVFAATDDDGDTHYAITAPNGTITDWEEVNNAGAGPANDANPRVDILVQTFDASFDDNSITRGSSTDLNVESQRGEYTFNVTSDDLSDSDIQDAFDTDRDAISDSDDGVEINVSSSDEDFRFAPDNEYDTGDFDLDFQVVDTGVTDSDSITVGSAADVDAQFTQNVYSQERGDIAEITVELTETNSTVVVIGGEEANYQAEVRLDDTNDDDEVTLLFNTSAAAAEDIEQSEYFDSDGDQDAALNAAFIAEGDDEIGFANQVIDPEGPPIDTGEYELTARAAAEDQDSGLLDLNERGTEDGRALIAPSDLNNDDEEYEDVEELRNATTPAQTVAQGDQVVVQYNVTGIYGYTSDIEDFRNADFDDVDDEEDLDFGDEVALSLDKIEDEGINRQEDSVGDITDEAEVYTDGDNGTMYVVLDTDSFDQLEAADYEMTFSVVANNRYASDETDDGTAESANVSFTIEERSLQFDTDEQGIVTVDPEANQTIAGATNLAPGTTFDLRARASTFLFTEEVEVQNEGRFSTAFDFSNVSENTSFVVTEESLQGIEDDAETPGRVGQAETGAATFNNQTFTGSATSVNVASVTVSEGGFVTIHDSTLLDGAVFDSVRGTSDYLEPGTVENVTVELDRPITANESGDTFIAMPHLDSNGNEAYDFVTSEGAEDAPYADSEGNAVVDTATITVNPVATATFEDQETEGDSVVVASTSLPSGGFVTIHDNTVADDPFGSVRGTSDYLEPGESTDIEVSLDDPVEESGQFFAMPHRDTDGDETYDFVSSDGADDAPYLNANGEIVLDGAQLTLPSMSTATPTPTDTPEPDTPTPTDEPTDSPTDTETTSGGQPGFGLALSLIALIGAALIALRRRD